MRRKKEKMSGIILFPIIVAAAVFIFIMAISNLEQGNREEEKAQLEQALKRCVVTCYAMEGMYPPNLEYMEEHYGIMLDEERYIVHYEVFADNLMPSITVLEREE